MAAMAHTSLLQQADAFLDEEAQRQQARRLGERLWKVFPPAKERVSTQIRNLQQIVVSATRFSDIEDFVKNQMGRERTGREWREVGEEVLQQLQNLRQQAARWTTDPHQQLTLRLHLARGWVRAVVGAYLYAKAHQEMTTPSRR